MDGPLVRREELMRLSGATRAQVAHWTKLGLLQPARPSKGPRSPHLWDLRGVVVARTLARLRQEGLSLQQLRALVAALRRFRLGGPEALASPKLLLLGRQAYWITSEHEALEILGRRPGQLAWRSALIVNLADVLEDIEARARRAGLHEVREAAREALLRTAT